MHLKKVISKKRKI